MKNTLFSVKIHDKSYQLEKEESKQMDLIQTGQNAYHALHDGKSFNIELIDKNIANRTISMNINEQYVTVQLDDERFNLIKELGFDLDIKKKVDQITAPMPGLVVEVLVSEGDVVKEGDPILILEAMKMENIIHAPCDATIQEVLVSKDDKVEKLSKLIGLA